MMYIPPTPVQGCALHQVEVRSAVSTKVYNSKQLSRSLTLTIDGQRDSDANSVALCLFLKADEQRLVSYASGHCTHSTTSAKPLFVLPALHQTEQLVEHLPWQSACY
jgi:hypothetical protein